MQIDDATWKRIHFIQFTFRRVKQLHPIEAQFEKKRLFNMKMKKLSRNAQTRRVQIMVLKVF